MDYERRSSNDEDNEDDDVAILIQPNVDDLLLNQSETKVKWRSIRICYVVMFFTSISYSIQMPSLWPYMTTIDKSYTKELLGWVVSAYSIGQLIGCPLFSSLSGYLKKFKYVLICSCCICAVGNYLYAIVRDVPHYNNIATITLIGSRALIGFSGGNVASIRLFISISTTDEERLVPMATMSACQALGFILGPGIQAVLVFIGYPGPITIPYFTIDTYTAGAFFSILGNLAQILFLVFLFSDSFLTKFYNENDINVNNNNDDDDPLIPNKHMSINSDYNKESNYVVAVYMMLAFFICMMSLSVIETVISPMCMDNFGWSESKATLVTSILLACSGLLSLGVFAGVKFITKYVKENYVLVFAFVMVLLSSLSLIPYGSDHIPIMPSPINNSTALSTTTSSTMEPFTMTTPTILEPSVIDEAMDFDFVSDNRKTMNNSTFIGLGCNVNYQKWCMYVPPIKLWQLIVNGALFTIGYPCANILSYVIFSRVIKLSDQSLWMGLLTATGCLARIIGPLMISSLYHSFGTQIAFGVWSAILTVFLMTTPFFIYISVFRRPSSTDTHIQ